MKVEVDFSQNCCNEVKNVEWFDSILESGVSFSSLKDVEHIVPEKNYDEL